MLKLIEKSTYLFMHLCHYNFSAFSYYDKLANYGNIANKFFSVFRHGPPMPL